MADNTVLNAGSGGDTIATDDIGGTKHQYVKVEFGVADTATPVSTANPLPVDQTNTTVADGGTLPAKGVQVGGTDGTVFQVLSTDSAGRANVNINGTVPVSAASLPLPAGASTAAKQPALGTAGTPSTDVLSVQGVAGGTAVPVSGTVTATTGGLTDTQLRATAVPVSGTVTATGPLTDTQLRATAVPVSGTVTANLGTAAVTNAGTFAVQIAANSSVNVAQVAGTATDVNSGNKSPGTQRIVIATDQPQLTNAWKVDGSAVTQPVSAAVGAPVFTTPTPSTTGGWTPKVFTALTNTKTLIKNAAGTLGGYLPIWNPNLSVAYIQVFDAAATATPTLGTTPPDAILPIPPGSAANMEAASGVHFANGIVIAITTTATGSTAPGTGLDGTLLFK